MGPIVNTDRFMGWIPATAKDIKKLRKLGVVGKMEPRNDNGKEYLSYCEATKSVIRKIEKEGFLFC